MRPKRTPLLLPHGTPAVVVDPLRAFLERDGLFTKCYGLDDAKPVRDLRTTLRLMVRAWDKRAKLMLCKSHYRHDQFGVPGLEELCTDADEYGRESVLPETGFQYMFEKTDNSLLTAEAGVVDMLLRDCRYLIVTGVTTTSCVARTVEDCAERFSGKMQIIVPADAVASRAGRAKDQAALLEQWADPANENVVVVSSWKDIVFDQPKRPAAKERVKG